ncbi:ammonia-forming cytochrome c nitrite reductase subunit c552 [Helicobacter monodelphidis]|uniref:ammonia-forming cytochrome c nitrite reductase n=1 Tax=Helicobacter sp. 15-1451 TaxID=2004995 RepID=UPI000DCCFB2B|nr:ammonia-forming cytochrome c nitrite reductase [Helicobacter sp. 15-1451]RAX57669.1 ammonia-forming cytochrome c nitrite reductase subunit c552 [Helicobacter sp. 15-1451]
MKYKTLLIGSLSAIVVMGLLVGNINARENERESLLKKPTEETGIPNKEKSDEWAKYYPREFDSWRRTKESETIEDMLEKNPALVVAWAGYAFSRDYNAPRGHYYAVQDNINTLRTGAPTDDKTGPQPTACWTCKSTDVPRLMEEEGELEFFTGKWARLGSEVVNPVGCSNCHDDKTAELKISVPYFDRGLQAAGMPTFAESTHQQKRSLVCAQCHVEYYFKKTEYIDKNNQPQTAMVVTLPWAKGTTVEEIEKYYDEINFVDFTHSISKTPMLKAQHPDFELFQIGIHGKKGVSCADCHMPYTQEGSVKYSDHRIASPLENIDKTCLNCHRDSEKNLMTIVGEKRERKDILQTIAFDNIAKAHLETGKALEAGASLDELKEVHTLIRHAQWRGDMAIAGHGSFFHAPEEVLKLLASANEEAQKARIKLVGILAKHGITNYIAPDFSTKQAAQNAIGLNLQPFIDEKLKFKETLEKEWKKQAIEKGRINAKAAEDIPDNATSYFKK